MAAWRRREVRRKEYRNMITKSNTVIRINAANTDGRGKLTVVSEREIGEVLLRVRSPRGEEISFRFFGTGKRAEGDFSVTEPVLWSVASPALYDFTVEIVCGAETERAGGKFAFRTLGTDEKNRVCLNGQPLFLKGYIRGAAAHEHGNDAGLSEEAFYRKNIRAAKRFGFNLVRFHSVVPNETFFRVADEEGLLVHVELRPPHDVYNNLSEMVNTGSVIVEDDFIRRVMDENYEHPSLAVYCIGNEIKHASEQRVAEIGRLIRSYDPDRLYIDTCAWGKIGRPYITADVQHMGYYFPFGRHAGMFGDTDSLSVECAREDTPVGAEGSGWKVRRTLSLRVPLIAHEVCHYTALRDFLSLREKFERYGTAQPWWIGEELKMIRAKGMEDEYPEMFRASKFFQYECWKTAFEDIRSSRLLAGFHFLQFADTDVYENSNGVVDCFDDEMYVTERQFLPFNGDRVLIAQLGGRLFWGESELAVPLLCSDYAQDGIEAADVHFSLCGGSGEVYAEGGLPNIDLHEKGVKKLCTIRMRLPKVAESEQLTLRARLCAAGGVCAENEWKIWVYRPRPAKRYAEFVSVEREEGCITDSPEKALSRLAEGKRVCLVYRSDWTRHVAHKNMRPPRYAFEATWNRFKPVIWDRGTNYGGLCEDALLQKYGFAGGRYYDFNYSVLTEDCDKIVLDRFPVPVRSLITGIDKNVRDRFDAGKDYFNEKELMYDRTLRRFSYLFEVGAGRGSLLVCGLNLTGLDENEPSSAAAADFLLRYLFSEDFHPKTTISLEALEKYLSDCAKRPVKERMMTQFWQLDDAPVESKQYWKESQQYLLED